MIGYSHFKLLLRTTNYQNHCSTLLSAVLLILGFATTIGGWMHWALTVGLCVSSLHVHIHLQRPNDRVRIDCTDEKSSLVAALLGGHFPPSHPLSDV